MVSRLYVRLSVDLRPFFSNVPSVFRSSCTHPATKKLQSVPSPRNPDLWLLSPARTPTKSRRRVRLIRFGRATVALCCILSDTVLYLCSLMPYIRARNALKAPL